MNKNKNTLFILLSIIGILLLLCIYLLFIKKDTANNTLGLKDASGNDISINYEKLEIELLKNNNVYLSVCESCAEIDEGNINDVKCNKKSLSVSTISTFISKLKSAKSVEYLPTSKVCSLYTYSVGNDFVAFDGDDTSILLVGLNNNGYAFHFPNENIVTFLNGLK